MAAKKKSPRGKRIDAQVKAAAKKKAPTKAEVGIRIMKQAVQMVADGQSIQAMELLQTKAKAACPDQAKAQKIIFAMQNG